MAIFNEPVSITDHDKLSIQKIGKAAQAIKYRFKQVRGRISTKASKIIRVISIIGCSFAIVQITTFCYY
jgi:hypothetical protein